MYYQKITNPRTNRENKVKVFEVSGKEAIDILCQDNGTKKLSWHLLDQPESVEAMESGMGGESASSNFALSVFEHGLDWDIGLTILRFLKVYHATYPGKRPRTIRCAVTRVGDVYILDKEHKVMFGA